MTKIAFAGFAGSLVAVLSLAASCSDDDDASASSTMSNTTTTGGAGGVGGTGGGGQGGQQDGPELFVAFDVAAAELPEGVSADSRGDLYVTMVATGAVVKVTPEGEVSPVAQFALPPPLGESVLTGIIHDDSDAMYVAVGSSDQQALATGVYRIPDGGGTPSLFATDPALVFPNDFAWDGQGRLFVSESVTGAIFHDDGNGGLVEWLRDPLIAGDVDACNSPNEFDFGANGIEIDGTTMYIANTDLGSIVRVPIESDGTAGVPQAWVTPDCSRAGMDGIVMGPNGILYGAVNRADEIVAVDADGTVTTYASGDVFDYPASLTVWSGRGTDELIVTNFALDSFLAMEPANPALIAVRLP